MLVPACGKPACTEAAETTAGRNTRKREKGNCEETRNHNEKEKRGSTA
jgi:hypothetical protein